MLLSIGVGIVAGLGAILFDRLLGWTLHAVLESVTGYAEPRAGSPAASLFTFAPARSLWFFIVPALGGLVSGVIVYLVAPEAEGHGTDAMIDAFHLRGGKIRKRVPFVKIIASALTIGTGGSAGKEGPIAQIGSGFGSVFASLLKLKPRERRILVLAGAAGGSGGVFGPSVFIGAMLGGAFGFLGHQVAPGWVVNPNSFVLVGIGGFFAGVARTPVSSIIMACEMSASYTLLVPLMLVSSISYLLLRNTSLYEKQQISRIASPAHLTEFARGMLERIRVHEAIREQPVIRIPEQMPFGDLVKTVTRSGASHFPVVDREGRMTGIVSINDIRAVLFEETIDQLIVARDVATPNVVRVFRNDTLREALEKMAAIDVDELPVAYEEKPDEIVGMISKRDIVDYYFGRSGA